MTKIEPKQLTPRGEERKNALIASAMKLFGKKGYHATTIDDIVKSAGTGKGTFYWYWKSKDELFLELISHKFDTYLSALKSIEKRNLPAEDKLVIIVAEVATLFVKYRQFCKLIFLLISDDKERFRNDIVEKTRNYYMQFKKILSRVIKEGQKVGAVSANLKAENTASLLIGIIDGIVAQETILGTQLSIPELGDTVMHILRFGVFAKK